MDFNNKTITKKEALKNNMQIWQGNDGQFFARLQFDKDRESPLYGYVFTIIN